MRALTSVAVAAGVVGLTALSASAQSGKVAALVEDVSNGIAGVEVLDYVNDGQTINLGANGKLVLSYMDSCQRETISGGTVTVGARQSTVNGGQVQTTRLQCDRKALTLAAQQAGQSGAAATRSVDRALAGGLGALPQPELTVQSVMPVIRVKAPGTVSFKRLDKQSPVISVPVSGRAVDMSSGSTKLEAGGLYEVALGDRSLIVKVGDRARTTAGGAVGDRLIPLL